MDIADHDVRSLDAETRVGARRFVLGLVAGLLCGGVLGMLGSVPDAGSGAGEGAEPERGRAVTVVDA